MELADTSYYTPAIYDTDERDSIRVVSTSESAEIALLTSKEKLNDLLKKNAQKIERLSNLENIPLSEREYVTHAATILYLGNGLISLQNYSGFYMWGAAHGVHGSSEYTYAFTGCKQGGIADTLVDLSSNYTAEEIHEIKRGLYFMNHERRYIDLLSEEEDTTEFDIKKYKYIAIDGYEADDFFGDVDYNDFHYVVKRKKATPTVCAQAYQASSYAETGDYTLTVEYPFDHYSYVSSPLIWFYPKAEQPNLVDYTISPGQNTVIMLLEIPEENRYEVQLLDVATQQITQCFDAPSGRMIMAEWAIGDNALRWKARFEKER